MTHLYTKYNHLTDKELISLTENSDDEMVIELVNRMNKILDDLNYLERHCECGDILICEACG